jgi:uncharacterized SAM-binding protein YcdF (DUF218 family)
MKSPLPDYSRIARSALRFVRNALLICGVVFVSTVLLAMSSLPARVDRWLVNPPSTLQGDPALIVVLGGGGIPSESGLMRTYYGALAAAKYPGAEIVLALPEVVDVSSSALIRMRDELIMRGVDSDRILLAPYGANTRAQAVEVKRMMGAGSARMPILLVSSPDHLRRAVLTFRKVGFNHVGSYAALNTYDEGEYSLDPEAVDDTLSIPSVENNLVVRYKLWAQLELCVGSLRELVALAYYRVKEWI